MSEHPVEKNVNKDAEVGLASDDEAYWICSAKIDDVVCCHCNYDSDEHCIRCGGPKAN